MSADEGRTAAYEAEEAAFGGTELDDERSVDELTAAAAAVTAGEWWRTAGGPAVVVAAARRDATASSARSRAGRVDVRLAPGQRTLATLTHELAHALAGVDHGHDATFRAAHVDVAALVAGGRAAQQLASSYARLGVPPGARRWPPPVRATGAGFAIVP